MWNAEDQGTIDSLTTRTANSSGSIRMTVDDRLLACGKAVDDAIGRDLPASMLADTLKSFGLKASEAVDYLDEFNQRIAIRGSKEKQQASLPRESSSGGQDQGQDQRQRDIAVEEAAWASLRAKLEQATPSVDPSSIVLDRMFDQTFASDSCSLISPLIQLVVHLFWTSIPHCGSRGTHFLHDSVLSLNSTFGSR